MSTTTNTSLPISVEQQEKRPERLPRRRSSMSSTGSSRSRSSSSSRSIRRKIVVSEKRRLLILALRYVISQKEYTFLRRRVLKKAPAAISTNTPTRAEFDAVVRAAAWDDFVPGSSRAGLRMFVLGNVVLNFFDYLAGQLRSRRAGSSPPPIRSLFVNKPNFLSSLSIATLVVLHRLLYRFFYQLKSNLQLPEAKAFRQKYPKASQLFLSPKAPSFVASLAGFALLIHPATDRRVTISVYTFVKALEFMYNRYEDEGWFRKKPWWFGSWMLFPLTSGQLLYSFLFYRDCFPQEYCDFITRYSTEYIQPRPADFPAHLPWPGPSDVLDSISKIASLRFPPFPSPILFPSATTLPESLSNISAIVAPAHPSIKSLQCALLHPAEPSCLKTYIHFWASELPRIAKFLAAIYSIAWIPRYKKLLSNPAFAVSRITGATAFTSLFITGALGSAWAACCCLQTILPRAFLPRFRFWIAGAVAGTWAFVDRDSSRANFLYSARIGLLSAWRVLQKRGVVRGVKNGDVLLFVMALMTVNCVYDRDAGAVSGGAARRVLASLRGRGFRDYVREKIERERRMEGEGERGERERVGGGKSPEFGMEGVVEEV